jgi:hypothetical protein
MVAPSIQPWVEQSNYFAGDGITSRYVRALVPIAMKARESEIIEDGSSSVLSSDDVIHVKGPRVDGGGQMAILASSAGASPDFPG